MADTAEKKATEKIETEIKKSSCGCGCGCVPPMKERK